MSLTEAPSVRKPTLLDQQEHRFPLRLGAEIRKIRDLFRAATRNQWDPRTDIDWSALDGLDIDDAHRYAARMYWSRRAWSEYGAISESPALLIRFCQERREPDLRYFFTIRTQEESRHAEACYLMAEHLGGYIQQPALVDFQKSVATHGVRKMALDPETPLEAIIAALVCAPRKSRSTCSAISSKSRPTRRPTRCCATSCATRCGIAALAGPISNTASGG
jgi:hypothetical protein